MDVNRDEVRRQLREIDQDGARELPRFRETLKRIFDADSSVGEEAKAGLLGVPSRRSFFAVGGAAVLGSAVMVGCGSAKKKQLTQTGTTETTSASTTTTAPGSEETDAISSMAKGIGAQPYDQPNTYLDILVVKPGLEAAADQDAVLALATVIEKTAAETYTYAGGTFTTADLRSAIMTIGPTEARHLSLLYILQDLDPTPVPFMATADRAVDDSFIGPDGPVKVPDAPTTTTTAAE